MLTSLFLLFLVSNFCFRSLFFVLEDGEQKKFKGKRNTLLSLFFVSW